MQKVFRSARPHERRPCGDGSRHHRTFIEAIRECADHNRIGIEEIAWFIPHQANQRMFQNIAQTLKLPFERFYLTLPKYGNISSASCAISLDEAIRDSSIRAGDLVCLPVFGSGLTWEQRSHPVVTTHRTPTRRNESAAGVGLSRAFVEDTEMSADDVLKAAGTGHARARHLSPPLAGGAKGGIGVAKASSAGSAAGGGPDR